MTKALPSNVSPLGDLAPFAAIGLIAVDIDGTLATHQGQDVGDLVKQAVMSLSHYGVTVTVATGRAVAGARNTIFGLNRRLGPAIVYNGAVTVDLGSERILDQTKIAMSVVEAIRDLTLTYSATMWAYDCSVPAFSNVEPLGITGKSSITESVAAWSSLRGPSEELNGLPVIWPDRTSPPGAAVAILIARSDGDLDGLLSQLSHLPGISITSSTAEYIEIRPAGATKASALEKLATQMGLSSRGVLTIGDNHNDVEMLEWAGVSVAVGNATETARNAASYSASQSEARGVVETLRIVISAKRFARGYLLKNRSD